MKSKLARKLMAGALGLALIPAISTTAMATSAAAGAAPAAVGAEAGAAPLALGQCNTHLNTRGYGTTYRLYVPALGTSRKCQMSDNTLKNSGVGVLQQTLKKCYGKNVTWDNQWGPETSGALWNVQYYSLGFRGSDADGFYGPRTHNAMKHIRVGGAGLCYRDSVNA